MLSRLMTMATCTLFPAIALAQDVGPTPLPVEPQDLDAALNLITLIISHAKDGKYLLAGAAATLVLVFAFRKFAMPRLKLKPGVLPLVSAITGALSGWGIAVMAGATAGQAAVALLSGPIASTLWDALVKYFFKKDPA
jgi:hypothetical protein